MVVLKFYSTFLQTFSMAAYQLSVNAKLYNVEAEPDTPLLWILREWLDLTGTKFGCGVNTCGACNVLIDGRALRSCQTPVRICEGRKITTIEGLSTDGSHPVQKAWEEMSVPQCGYCQPGQMIALTGLLNQTKKPTKEQIASVMSQQLCRCGTYHRIEQAVNRAIELSNQ